MMAIDMGGDWVKVGTKIRCKELITFDNPFIRGRPFKIPVGREAAIVSIGPGETRDEDGHPVWVEDIELGHIVVGWFDFGTGKRNGYYTQMRGDFVYFWEPLVVVQARERPNRPMIGRRHPDMPGRETKQSHIGFWASSADPDADRYAQQGLELPWPQDFVDESWDPKERAMVVQYLKQAIAIEHWMGESSCRFGCADSNGAADQGDEHYVWPEGFAHYIEAHGVKPPQEFIDHVWRANGIMKAHY